MGHGAFVPHFYEQILEYYKAHVDEWVVVYEDTNNIDIVNS